VIIAAFTANMVRNQTAGESPLGVTTTQLKKTQDAGL